MNYNWFKHRRVPKSDLTLPAIMLACLLGAILWSLLYFIATSLH